MAESLEARFSDLANQWRHAAGHFSFWHLMREHPACQSIIDMGEPILPIILSRLNTNPRSPFSSIGWHGVLSEITGAQVGGECVEIEGGFAKADVTCLMESWKRWGVSNGYLSENPEI